MAPVAAVAGVVIAAAGAADTAYNAHAAQTAAGMLPAPQALVPQAANPVNAPAQAIQGTNAAKGAAVGGGAGTILTSPLGVAGPANQGPKSLLGL